MPTPPIADSHLVHAVDAVAKADGNVTKAAEALKISRGTLQGRLRTAAMRGIKPGHVVQPDAPAVAVTRDVELESMRRQLRDAQAGETLQKWAKALVMGLDGKAEQRGPANWLSEHISTPTGAGIPTLFLSDLHWGEVVRADEIGGINFYDMEEAQRRLQSTVQKTSILLRDHVVGDYPGIVLCLGGDMISGAIHEELEQTNDGTVVEQMLNLFENLQTTIQVLADEFGRVHVPCVTGNHGRMNRKWQAKQRAHLSYEWLMYQFLQRAFVNDSRVSFQIPDGPDADYDLLGTRYRLTHGDTFKGGDGIIGPIGPVTRGTLKRGRMATAMGAPFDMLLLGHWHTLTWGANFIINGSLKGFDEYAMTLSVTPEPAAQALWLTTENHGRTILLPVYP